MLKSTEFWKRFLITYFGLVAGIWGFLEAYTYFKGNSLKRTLGPYWVLIYSFPLVLALVIAILGSSKDDTKSTHKRLTVVVVIILIASGVIFSWNMGWLAWLQHPVTWPLWGLILYSLILLCAPVVLLAILIRYSNRFKSDDLNGLLDEKPYYTIYGARWSKSNITGRLQRPPICDNCLMEMRNLGMPSSYRFEEVWQCRQCGYKIEWKVSEHGDLLKDVEAHYRAEIRRKFENHIEQRFKP
jgi:hypothetical protein